VEKQIKLNKILNIIGIVAIVIGSIDPLEGSILILPGIILLTFSSFLINDTQKKLFLAISIMILFGVFFMFYFSSLGGFGGSSKLSWWWGLLILPYPIGWLTLIVVLISRAVKNRKRNELSK